MTRTGRNLAGIVLLLLLALVLALGAMVWLGSRDAANVPATTAQFDDHALIQRGAYLAQLGNCATCHTTSHGEPFAGGRALPTSFGTFYGTNITPDPRHGIGDWSADDFWRALHDGKRPDGSLLYPAFPYTSYTRMSRADSDALYAYLRTLPAVAQANPAHELSFPYDQRWGLAFWRALHFQPGSPPAANEQSELWLQGSYLVNGIGHCAECHTPRTRLGGLREDAPLGGTSMPMADWFAPALTPSQPDGLAGWTEDDVVDLLRIGHNRHGVAAGPMAEVVYNSSQYLSEQDANAIASYLLSLPASSQAAPEAVAGHLHTLGGQIYEQHCAECHGAQGEGKEPGWPPLAHNLTLTLTDPVNAIRKVLDGGFAPGTAGNPQPYGMPPFRHRLSDTDIAAVLSYTRNAWGNAAPSVMANTVRRARTLGQH